MKINLNFSADSANNMNISTSRKFGESSFGESVNHLSRALIKTLKYKYNSLGRSLDMYSWHGKGKLNRSFSGTNLLYVSHPLYVSQFHFMCPIEFWCFFLTQIFIEKTRF